MTARPKVARRPDYSQSWNKQEAHKPAETSEEKAKRMAAEAAGRQAARARDALYFKQNLRVADLPDEALVDLYNECVAVLASTKPPKEPSR